MNFKLNQGISALLVIIFTLSFFAAIPERSSAYNTGGTGRGYLTSIIELQKIKTKASYGNEPYASNVSELLEDAGNPTDWPYGSTSGTFSTASINGSAECVSPSHPSGDPTIDANRGSSLIYAKALAYQLTGDEAYAAFVRTRLLDLTDTTGYGGEIYSGSNQCILHLAFGIPNIIQSADLLDSYSGWTSADKVQFKTWLRNETYKKVAWASRSRKNNWGAAGSLTASMIADYTADMGGTLSEVKPTALTLTPTNAYTQHNQRQFDRMNAVWKGDSNCTIYGIQPYGGIPDETRRGSTGCTGQWIVDLDSSWSYQITQTTFLIYHSEYLRHRGTGSMYNNLKSDGTGSILRAIKFVIANPVNSAQSKDWKDSQKGSLFVAYRYYQDPLLRTTAESGTSFRGGGYLPYGRMTHSYAVTDTKPSTPTVAAP